MEAAVVVIVVLFAILAVGYFWCHFDSKKRDVVVVGHEPGTVKQRANTSFNGLFWKDASGSGDLNKRRRAIRGIGPTISVGLEAGPQGTKVTAWKSSWTTHYGIPALAFASWRQKRKVLRRGAR